MRKVFSFFLILVLLLASSNAFAKNAYQNYWKPGVYSVTVMEEEKKKYDELFEKALQMSEGTSIREGFDAQSLEGEYELYLYMLENCPFPEVYFDDLGTYIYACGFPDELAISQQDAFYIAYRTIQNEYKVTDDELTHFLPRYSYLTSDPDNPVWDISFVCYDDSITMSFTVSIYAHDGSIRGLSKSTQSFG